MHIFEDNTYGSKKNQTCTFSELTLSLTVTEFKINIEGLDYAMLGNKLEPTKDVIAINSNFIHKAFEGYEQYLSKLKGKRRCKRSTLDNPLNRRWRTGDGSTFNACIEFVIISADSVHTICYFPSSGSIQVFRSFDPIAIFLRYLSECSLPEFSSVELVDENKALLRNYKFVINIGSNKFIKFSTLAYTLEFMIRVHIWPKSGVVSNPYDFGDFICDVQSCPKVTPDLKLMPKMAKLY
ncbi:hypothetical protein RhiirC2_790914 [Rhizophagus irregularis]|uniref:Uncharacterized protein n=1 Tax=Rhizophagus irregularis TaxID=588596 RepID=A0A2N1MKD0_9GLOM|nr:hypothetical protein RhiirC2_790914 [Rhizophagus irregularis]